jgi:hypothetical protein
MIEYNINVVLSPFNFEIENLSNTAAFDMEKAG